MRPAFRKALVGIAAAVVLLLAVAVIIVPRFLNQGTYRNAIASAFQNATGRTIVLEGDLKPTFFPWLGVKTGPVKVGNAAGFAPEWFITADSMNIKARLWPLLREHRIEMDSIVLARPEIFLTRNAQGATNLDDLAARAEAMEEKTPAPGKGKLAWALFVKGLNIRDGRITWDDEQNNRRYLLSGIDFSAGALGLSEATQAAPAKLSLACYLTSRRPDLEGPVKLTAMVALAKDLRHVRFQDVSLDIGLRSKTLLPAATGEAKATATGTVTLDLGQASIATADLKANVLDVRMAVRAGWRTDLEGASGSLSVEQFSPRHLMEALGKGKPTRDPDVLSSAKAAMEFQTSQGSTQLRKIEAMLDATTFSGTADIRYGGQRPLLAFDLTGSSLDADRYLAPEEKGKPASEQKPPAPAGGPQSMDLDGRVRLSGLKVHELALSNVDMRIASTGGVLRLNPVTAALYGGTAKLDLTAAQQGQGVKADVGLDLENVQVQPMLVALARKDTVQGTGTVKARLSAHGQNKEAFLRSLGGQTDIAVRNGVIRGFNISAKNQEKEGKPRFTGPDLQTPFSLLSAPATMSQGVARSKDLRFVTDNYTVTGGGSLDIVDKTIDASLNLDMTALPRIPVHMSGPAAKPHVAVDKTSMLKGTAWGLFKLPFSIGQGALGIVTNGLENLFGGQ